MSASYDGSASNGPEPWTHRFAYTICTMSDRALRGRMRKPRTAHPGPKAKLLNQASYIWKGERHHWVLASNHEAHRACSIGDMYDLEYFDAHAQPLSA